MTRFGTHSLSVPDKAALAAHLVNIQAGGALFYQTERDFARSIKQALPDCHVVMRSYPDKDNIRNFPNVDDWIDRNQSLGDGGLIVQTTNEIAWSPDNIDWHVRLLTRIKERQLGLRVGMFALATGNPVDVNSWYLGEKLFRLAATMRDQAFMLLHEYFGGVVTSGIVGGSPQDTRYHPDYVPMANWPKDTSNLTLFHVGRHRFLLNYLKSKSIPAPRILITEFGADYLGDVGTWLASLTSDSARANYPDTVDGWRELTTQWGKWYPGMSAPDVYMEMWKYADQHLISPEVEAILPYCDGYDPNWTKYRNDPEMNRPLELYAGHAPVVIPSQPTQPTEPPPPIETLPSKEVVDFRRLLQLDHEAKLLQVQIRAREVANEADEKELDIIVREIETLLDTWHKIYDKAS
jgi:hypothetical protein